LQRGQFPASAEANGGNIYGSTFFMATGFHGFHVIVGTIFLIICLIRANRGDFTPRQHFGFEAAAWYWHFVDVVWLFLFAFVYVAPHIVWGPGAPGLEH
jgi:cytochrome c oxidase subunit 3